MMAKKLSLCYALLLASATEAFMRPAAIRVGAAPLFQSTETANTNKAGGVAGELGNPCEDECAMTSYPNLPESVHPGVLSGQAMVDLLKHAKENGKCHHPPIFHSSMMCWILVVDLSRVKFAGSAENFQIIISPSIQQHSKT